MSGVRRVRIAEEFSPYPGGRLRTGGDYSGEQFRETFGSLLAQFDHVVFDLDGTIGLPASFLEEAFGGLVRSAASFGLTAAEAASKIEVVCNDHPAYADMARRFIDEAVKR